MKLLRHRIDASEHELKQQLPENPDTCGFIPQFVHSIRVEHEPSQPSAISGAHFEVVEKKYPTGVILVLEPRLCADKQTLKEGNRCLPRFIPASSPT